MRWLSNTPRMPKFRSTALGSMTVEAALVLPILLIVFIAVIDFGRVFYWSLALSNAARVGAEFGAIDSSNAFNESGMAARALAASDDIDVANVLNVFSCNGCSPKPNGTLCPFITPPPAPDNPCLCWDSTTMTESVMASCIATCNGIVHYYVNVQCRANFRTISSYLGLAPITLIRTVRLRVQ